MYAGTLLEIAMTHADSIILRAKRGDQNASGKLVNLWYKRIYNYSLKYIGNHDLAMEVTQKTFINMYRKISQLEDIDKFKPWLYRIAANACHEEYRQNSRINSLFIETENENREERIDFVESPVVEAQLQQNDLNKLIQHALQELSVEQREVIIMKEYEGLKFLEIAEILDVSENTVKSRLYYALSHLKQFLADRQLTKENLYYES
ncbi:MAG: RNA polymerase sigma factor [Candidatus Cyclobacteriaceae bacterium M2_1C_046]